MDIIIPAHNEEARIGVTLDAYRAGCPGADVRFIVALDDCTDATADVVAGHAAADPRVSVLAFPKLGKGGVIIEAFRRCHADLVGFVDADCSTPPGELVRLAEVAERSGGAIASRRHPAALLPSGRAPGRATTSAGFNLLVQRLFELPYLDTQAGAKVMRRDVVEAVVPLLSARDFLFDVDLLVVARRLGYDVVEIPTIWIERGGSRVDPRGDARRMAASALSLWLHHRVRPIDRRARPSRGEEPRATEPVLQPDVALIAPYPLPGATAPGSGVATYTADLAGALHETGAGVLVLAPGGPADDRAAIDDGVAVRRLPAGPAFLPRAAAAAIRSGAPVVHLQHETFLYGRRGALPGLICALGALRAARRGPVVTLHHVFQPGAIDRAFVSSHRTRAPVPVARTALAAIQRIVRRLAAGVIVHERPFADHAPGAVVIPHGVKASSGAKREEARRALGLDDRLTALCFGFVAPYKSLEVALEAGERADDAVSIVVAGPDHPRLTAAGDSYADELRARWAGSARFTGPVPPEEVATWFAAADVALVLHGRPFASSGAAALAMAYDTPLLLSAPLADTAGAPQELAVPLDADALADRLRLLAGDAGALEQLATLSREHGAGRTWPEVARRHLELYKEVFPFRPRS